MGIKTKIPLMYNGTSLKTMKLIKTKIIILVLGSNLKFSFNPIISP